MESIFHEKQEGYLCAKHCLNALLQEQIFNAVDLATIAEQLDAEERRAMAESGEDTDDYQRFIKQPSGNMDDSGYFSVQVITQALKVYELELVPYTSTEPVALMAQKEPSQMKAYICNYKGHWFTIRKLGNQWFNLNSMLSGPQLISDTYLAMYLAQLIQEGYSIFIVNGNIPKCTADSVLSKNPIIPSKSSIVSLKANVPSTSGKEEVKFAGKGYRLDLMTEDEEKIMEVAHAFQSCVVPSTSQIDSRPEVEIISETPRQPRDRIIPIIRIDDRQQVHTVEDDDEDDELQKALKLSLENYEQEQRDRNLISRLEHPSTLSTNFGSVATTTDSPDDEEDDDLRRALQLSLECVTAPPTPDQEDIRWRRLNYLMMQSNPQSENSTKLNT
ncbi:ataxin-3-like [Phymastichus coffea]|uniref:ataxin-3-like n=1 Tax=Phymastichus coffea TaxID=108790 RepID=UPI00273B3835|nr:ataxin-3-like [Phymastichus coffea]